MGTDLLVTAPAPPTSVAGCVTSSDRDVPHPDLTTGDRAAIAAAVTRYTAAIGACLAGIAAGTALAAVVPVVGAVLLLGSFLTGVVAFARRLDLTHPRPGSRFHGRPIILRVNPVAAAAHGRWLDHDGGEPGTAEEVGVLLTQLAELTSAGRGDSAAAATRDGATYCTLRMRAHDDDLSVLEGVDLVPGLLELLHGTLSQ